MKEQAKAGEGLLVEDVHIQRRENRCTPTFRLSSKENIRKRDHMGPWAVLASTFHRVET